MKICQVARYLRCRIICIRESEEKSVLDLINSIRSKSILYFISLLLSGGALLSIIAFFTPKV